jgi:hypothetical protein
MQMTCYIPFLSYVVPPSLYMFMLLAIRGLIVARKYVLTLILSYLYIDVLTLYDTLGITKLKFNSFNVDKTLTYAKKTPSLQLNQLKCIKEYQYICEHI